METTNTRPVENEAGNHNLRSKATRVGAMSDVVMQGDNERRDDQLNNCGMTNDEQGVDGGIGGSSLNGGQPKKKKKGRSYTKKYNIHKRGTAEPPIQLIINEHGQPIGENAKELSNFIATLVKSKNFSFNHKDWRLADPTQKFKLWRDLKLFYEVDEKVQDWVMGTAAKIWKDFKADLKATYFDETKTDKQLIALCDDRINPADWKWLINHWRSPLAKARSERGKANRARMSGLHTSGSMSHARVSHEMHTENGFQPRRDEVYIATHTRKDGHPSNDSQDKIIALQNAAENHPEWIEKSIADGDIMLRVFGPERNGYVRSIGKGPTPGDLRMPGKNKYRSTKVQMAIEGQRQAELEKEQLIQHLNEKQSENDRKIDALTEQVAKLTELLLANSQDGRQVHTSPRFASNSAIHEGNMLNRLSKFVVCFK